MLRSPVETSLPEWKTDWKQIQPALRKVRRSMAALRTSSLKVMRVSQLDSDILDLELVDILKEQLWNAFSLFKPNFKESFEPELLAILNLVLFKLSIYDSSATYGAQLQNLKYRNEWKHGGTLESIAKDAPLTKTQKILYGLLTVGGQYAWSRGNRIITARGWSELDEVPNPGGSIARDETSVCQEIIKSSSQFRIHEPSNGVARIYGISPVLSTIDQR
ncbi:peroxisome assembly protein (Peroxin-2) [Apophysomyces ossiformis]|uniref:RING-type E3 ubiquitin transferase (cysteine targeting) n=1 Tax=Apophysomyces ossiformis TaxID=679940 RepID=A0A8H7BP25_9FUNG|nr:peroxisome assembly protein (Peroxin-2) [Apophysomyces ossiformis]